MRSWSNFEHPVREALHQLKYRRNIGLGEALATQMSPFVAQLGWPVDTIIPIPLGKKRLKERGYNQVAMVAKPLALCLGMDYRPAALIRARETRSQVGLSAMERKQNVLNVFQADKNKIGGRTVLLMDDVSTTGATLSSAADALYTSGAKDVYAITVARALPYHGLKLV
jgi:ComF family protein